MIKHIIRCSRNSVSLTDKKGVEHGVRAYDSFEHAGFQLNEFGSIRSDFSTLVASNSILEMQNAANRIRQINASQPDTSGMSFEQIISVVEPRWCLESKGKQLAFQRYIIDNQLSDLYQYVNSTEPPKDGDTTTTVDENPAPAE